MSAAAADHFASLVADAGDGRLHATKAQVPDLGLHMVAGVEDGFQNETSSLVDAFFPYSRDGFKSPPFPAGLVHRWYIAGGGVVTGM